MSRIDPLLPDATGSFVTICRQIYPLCRHRGDDYIPPVYQRKNGINTTSWMKQRPTNNPAGIFFANKSRKTLRSSIPNGECT